jgi:hypothetical protein
MVEVVSRWPLTVEAQVHSWDSPCRICGGKSGNGTGFSLSSLVFPLVSLYHGSLLIYISPGG